MTSSTTFTFDFFKIAENFWIRIFALIISSDKSQSKAQINLESFGEYKIDYRAENIKFVSTNENFKKSPHLSTLLIYTLLKK